MRDTIYRDEAIEAIDKRIYALMKDPEYRKKGSHIDLYGAKELLRDLPSAERSQEWIPCSERLPEESGSYLTWSVIGFIPDHVDEPNTYEGVTIASFSKKFCDWFGAEKVYAWMPLPKPWKGADDEQP